MPIERLLIKLRGYGMPKYHVKLIESYLTGREYKFVVNGWTSDPIELLSGCSQGSTLGPLLFLIFINDISFEIEKLTRKRIVTYKKRTQDNTLVSKNINENMKYKHISKREEEDFNFADDLAALIAAKNLDELFKMGQDVADRLEKWSKDNNMLISIKKTKIMTIHANTTERHIQPNIHIDGETLENVDTFRYLGNYIDSKLTGKAHLDVIERKVNHSIAVISNLKEHVSKEKLLQWTQTFTYPLSYYGWKAMYPLMTDTDKEKWPPEF